MQSIKCLDKANALARRKTKKFRRQTSLNLSDIHVPIFHQYKHDYPYFGYVEVCLDHCEPFLMCSNNDDIVAQTYFWFGANSYERMSLAEWVSRSAHAQTVFDVGAFSGLYSLAANSMPNSNCHVVAFEPSRLTYSRLLMNIQVNQMYGDTTLVNRALSDTSAAQTFYQYRGEQVLGSGGSFVDKGIPIANDEELVNTTTFDDYVDLTGLMPDLIKVDVEFAEERVLLGMQSFLSDHSPDILIEADPSTLDAVSKILSNHNYRLYKVDEANMRLVPLDECVFDRTGNILAERR